MTTKLESYIATKPTSATKRALVYEAVHDVARSRSEIARVTGLRLSSVCGRVNELLAEGLVYVFGTRWDHETNRNVETIAASG